MENQIFENKSLKKLSFDSNGNWKPSESDRENIAKPCVAFANAKDGGTLFIGIEDGEKLPPATQIIFDQDLPNKIRKRISDLTQNVAVVARIQSYPNDGQAIEIKILPSKQTIASTNDGRYYLRISDNSVALLPEDLSQLLTDKPSFIWETQKKTNIPRERIDDGKLRNFISEIRSASETKVNNHIKQKSDEEILEHYFFTDGDCLTNLGVLWIGSRKDRGNISYCPTVVFLKYDERGERVKKIPLDDYYLNPRELVEEVLKFPEWQEGIEISNGIYRKFIPNYPEEVLRELLVNALVHRPYTQRGDVTIKLSPDYLEITNPGRFPLGVNAANFLHKSVCRNEKLAATFRALGLMEKEGSGIDKIYESLLSKGKTLPTVFEGDDFVSIRIEQRILNKETIGLVERAKAKEPDLTQRELISLGLIAENNSLSALEFVKKLNLDASPSNNPTTQWLGNLQNLGIICSRGKTKAVEYFVNPEFLKNNNFKGQTSLKGIEDHRLEELIYRDISIYHPSSVSEIHQRIGKEIVLRKLRRMLNKMVERKSIYKRGDKKWTRYSIDQSKI